MKEEEEMEDTKTHFFQVMVDDFRQRMPIPQAFGKHIQKTSSEKVILWTPNGSRWCARLKRTKDGMHLEDGWERFSRANSISEGEILSFKNDGNMHFTVRIFGTSSLERESVVNVTNCKEVTTCEGSKMQLRVPKEETENPLRTLITSYSPIQNAEHNQIVCLPEQRKPYLHDQSDSQQDISARRDLVEAARALKLEHPSFTVIMHRSYIQSYLPIPKKFGKIHFQKEVKSLKLKVSDGRTWRCRCSQDRCCFKLLRGWRAFVRGMKLKMGNICVFELMMDPPPKKVYLKVHIFRY